MKKYLIMILSLATIFCFAGCSGNNNTPNQNSTVENSDTSTVESDDTSNVSDTSTQSENDTVVVPNVVGMNKEEAVDQLEKNGLKVEIVYKIMQVQDYVNNKVIYYDDNLVINQSHKNGTVVVSGTPIEIVINQKVSDMKYTVNSDNTITLTKLGDTLFYPDKKFYIPKEYYGYKVSRVNSEMLNSKPTDAWKNPITYYVPYDVVIDGDVSVGIVRY